MDELRSELIALLAAVIYLAGVQLLKRLRVWLDRRDVLPESEEPTSQTSEGGTQEHPSD